MSLFNLIQGLQSQTPQTATQTPTTTATPTQSATSMPSGMSLAQRIAWGAEHPYTPNYTYGEGAALKDSFAANPTYNYAGSTLNEQMRNAMDWQNSSGGAWAGLGGDRMFSEMEQALAARGITNLNQVGMQNKYEYRPVTDERDDYGNRTGRRFITLPGADENSPGKQYFLTQGDVANLTKRPNEDGSGTGDYLEALTGQNLYSGNNVGGWSTIGNVFGNSYAGDGGTHFMLVPQADGRVKIRTYGTSSADFGKEDLMGVASVLGIAAGGAALAGSMSGGGAAGVGATDIGAGAGGFSGDFTAAGYGGLDAAGTTSLGGGYSVAGGAPLSSIGTAGAGSVGISDTLSKAALDGTNVFGANSVPGALDVSSLVNAAPGVESANAVGQIASNLGYTGPTSVSSSLGSNNPAMQGPSATPSGSGLPSVPPGASSVIQNILGGGQNGSNTVGTQSGVGGMDLNGIAGLLSGVYGYNQQNNASNDMLNYLKQRQAINDNMYAPGSAEYNALWDEMSRKDAAAGRNSQYGPRSVDLAARIAQLKMDANTRMTQGIGGLYANALNQRANSGANITSMIPGLLGTGGIQNLSSLVGGLGGLFGGGSTVTADDWNNLGDGLGDVDYSNMFNDMDFGSLFG